MKTDDLLDALFAPFCEKLAESYVDEAKAKGPLLMQEDLLKKQKQQALENVLKKELTSTKKELQQALLLLQETYSTLVPAKQEEIQNNLAPCLSKLKEMQESSKKKNIEEPKGLQDFLGLPNELCLWIYEVGYSFFQKKEEEKAICLFKLLTFLNDAVPDYWIALGQTQRALHQEEKALYSFAIASIFCPENPVCHYHSCDIYLSQGLLSEASEELHILTEITKNKTEWLPAIETLHKKLQQVSQKKNGGNA